MKLATKIFDTFLSNIFYSTNILRSIATTSGYNQLRIPHSDPMLYVEYLMRNPLKFDQIYKYVDFKILNDIILKSGNDQQIESWNELIDNIKRQGDYKGLEYIKIKDYIQFELFINSIITTSTPYEDSCLSPDQYTVINGFENALRLYRFRFKSLL